MQQLCIDRPDLVKAAIVMGTGAWSTGWGWDYQEAEIEFRRRGGTLDGMMGVTHYAAMLYPARALGDRVLWPKLKALLLNSPEDGDNEESLVPQWDASLRFDQRARAARRQGPGPRHRLRRRRRSPAPGWRGARARQSRRQVPPAGGHGAWVVYGHAHEEINKVIEGIVRGAK